MRSTRKVLVIGASGFVGTAVVAALDDAGHAVETMAAPRLSPLQPHDAKAFVRETDLVAALTSRFVAMDAVVNAAGNPDASEGDEAKLVAANGALPGLLAAACAAAPRPPRFVQVSSAVVQGRAKRLDASGITDGFSAYARSKILGEQLTSLFAPGDSVIFRPPSVHSTDRRVTRMIARLAASPLATVARPGTAGSPQALLQNVGSAIAYLATTSLKPPPVVTHPSEGLTSSSVMELLGGRRPRRVPRTAARAVTMSLFAAGRLLPPLAANARRVELLWFGQEQAASWLTESGWEPPGRLDDWRALGEDVRRQSMTREQWKAS